MKLTHGGSTELPPATREDFSADLENVLYLPPRTKEIRESGFEMPPTRQPEVSPSMEDLAQGVGLIDRSIDQERLFASPLERYDFLVKKEASGEALTPEEVQFMAWFRAEYDEMLAMTGPKLARVE